MPLMFLSDSCLFELKVAHELLGRKAVENSTVENQRIRNEVIEQNWVSSSSDRSEQHLRSCVTFLITDRIVLFPKVLTRHFADMTLPEYTVSILLGAFERSVTSSAFLDLDRYRSIMLST